MKTFKLLKLAEIILTFCFVFSNLDFSFLPRFPVQPVTNSDPEKQQLKIRLPLNPNIIQLSQTPVQMKFA